MTAPSPNSGYALGQLLRALEVASSARDPALHARARARVAKWQAVLDGMASGAVEVGSRTPVAGAPAWATVEVVHGGFATGALLAGGALLTHEQELETRLGVSGRRALNDHFLSDVGRRELIDLLESGRYRIEVPEEGALLTLAWLVERGAAEAALNLLDAIEPFFGRLRFYPVPSDVPAAPKLTMHVATAEEVEQGLEELETPARVREMNEALSIWAPHTDRLVALFLETVFGDPPRLSPSNGSQERGDAGALVQGGWPCQVFPEGWRERAEAWLREDERLLGIYRGGRRVRHPRENLPTLRAALERLVGAPATSGPRGRLERTSGQRPRDDSATVRRVLAAMTGRRGAPGSPELTALRSKQATHAARPTHQALGRVLAARLADVPPRRGLADLEAVSHPVTEAEARPEFPAGTALPPALVARLVRALEGSAEELVERGVITSGGVLAKLLPQLTGQIRALGLEHPGARALYAQVYAAFRRRRSLLLLDYAKQVQLSELPWIAALDGLRTSALDGRATARQALDDLCLIYFRAFPQAILPNELRRELASLVQTAGLDLPLTDELAADIFMGGFSPKFLAAALVAAELLEGSLYERYYGLSYARVRDLTCLGPSEAVGTLTEMITGMARVEGDRFGVSRNGKIIEQQQVVTTQNLAAPFAALNLGPRLPLVELADACLTWVARRQRMKTDNGHAQLCTLKNCAYAWRQMLFFLALAAPEEAPRFGDRSRERFAELPDSLQIRMAPAFEGLWLILDGGRFDDTGRGPGGARRFLGWTTERHWMLPPPA